MSNRPAWALLYSPFQTPNPFCSSRLLCSCCNRVGTSTSSPTLPSPPSFSINIQPVPNPVHTFSTFLVSDLCFLSSPQVKSTLRGTAILIFLNRWSDHITLSLYWPSAGRWRQAPLLCMAFATLYDVGEMSPSHSFLQPSRRLQPSRQAELFPISQTFPGLSVSRCPSLLFGMFQCAAFLVKFHSLF